MSETFDEDDAANCILEIRAACGLLTCAAENTVHQLEYDQIYFVANSIRDRIDMIEKFMKSKDAANV